MKAPQHITVNLDDRSYDIMVGSDLLANASSHIIPLLSRPRLVVVTDETVDKLHFEKLSRSLVDAGVTVDKLVMPAGEHTKSFRQLEQLCESLLQLKIERSDMIAALGGGVIGDVTGFAAAILKRGCPFIQIPTTLLAQVDSSVGGKTAINTKSGKNLIGAFHQPALVLADVDLLGTLPKRELLAGYAEIVKYGLLGDAGFFDWLEQHGKELISSNTAAQIEAVTRSVLAKAKIVELDERESGVRALLNLGHTFGHALEAQMGFSNKLLHGESVALGMILAFEFSEQEGICDKGHAQRVKDHFKAVGLPIAIQEIGGFSATASDLMNHVYQDKKVSDGKLAFILIRGIGNAFIANNVSPDCIKSFFESKL